MPIKKHKKLDPFALVRANALALIGQPRQSSVIVGSAASRQIAHRSGK
jgi:hypothetical protein